MAVLSVAGFVLLLAVGLVLISHQFTPELEVHVGGYVKPGFEEVDQVFRKLIQTHMSGAAFSAYYQGEPVVDLWGGYADIDADELWDEDTISIAFSTTKGMAALVVGVLVTRGHVKYDDPITKYWPEFGANRKEKITLRMYLNHEAGLPALDTPLTLDELKNNPTKVSKVLAEQKPLWEPGSATGYHAITFGLHIDQIVQRVDPRKRNVTQFFEDEIAKPLGLDFSLYLKPSECYRDTRLNYGNSLLDALSASVETRDFSIFKMVYDMSRDPEGLAGKAMKPIIYPQSWNNKHKKMAQVSSYSGHGTARAIAKVFGMVVMDGAKVNGKPLISAEVLSDFMRVPAEIKLDKIYKLPMSFSAGMALMKTPAGDWMFGAPGYGGQMGFSDPKKKIGIGFLTNHLRLYRIEKDPRINSLFNAVYASVKRMEESKKQF